MKAMVLNRLCDLKEERQPLALQDMPQPRPADNEILVKVSVCGVCHTELDEIEGRLYRYARSGHHAQIN